MTCPCRSTSSLARVPSDLDRASPSLNWCIARRCLLGSAITRTEDESCAPQPHPHIISGRQLTRLPTFRNKGSMSRLRPNTMPSLLLPRCLEPSTSTAATSVGSPQAPSPQEAASRSPYFKPILMLSMESELSWARADLAQMKYTPVSPLPLHDGRERASYALDIHSQWQQAETSGWIRYTIPSGVESSSIDHGLEVTPIAMALGTTSRTQSLGHQIALTKQAAATSPSSSPHRLAPRTKTSKDVSDRITPSQNKNWQRRQPASCATSEPLRAHMLVRTPKRVPLRTVLGLPGAAFTLLGMPKTSSIPS